MSANQEPMAALSEIVDLLDGFEWNAVCSTEREKGYAQGYEAAMRDVARILRKKAHFFGLPNEITCSGCSEVVEFSSGAGFSACGCGIINPRPGVFGGGHE